MKARKPKKSKSLTRQRTWLPDDATFSGERKRERSMRPEEGLAEAMEACFSPGLETNGLVVSPYGVLAFVEVDGEERLCSVADSLILGKTSVLAPGDAVYVEDAGDKPVVRAVARRRTRLGRVATGQNREHVIAANIDVLVIVAAAAQPVFKRGLVDRFLVSAQLGGVEPILCLNKIDLTDGELPEAVNAYIDAGLRVFPTSCSTGQGVQALWDSLKGKLAVLAGHSGVGKSTLINALAPDLDLATQTISESNEKGRHTTTASRIYCLPGDVRVVDTPGIRQLGLWGVSKEELPRYFPEMAQPATGCRFRDCSHIHEPNCAVRDALENGQLSRLRYDSYRWIRESIGTTKKIVIE